MVNIYVPLLPVCVVPYPFAEIREEKKNIRAQLLGGRLALNQGFLFAVFKSLFRDNFLCYF